MSNLLQPHRLLVLDDDTNVNLTICAIAERTGFETQATTSVTEFFELLSAWKPSHVIIDLVMPETDGVEVLRQLANGRCDAKVIIATGLGTRVLEAAGRAANENGLHLVGILPKPFSPGKLRELLQINLTLNGHSADPLTKRNIHKLKVTEKMLSDALAARELDVYFQPKIACNSKAIVGFECLARWPHSEVGMIPPDQFIPIAEASCLIDTLTQQIFTKALCWFATLSDHHSLKLSLNISAKSLERWDISAWLRQQCYKSEIRPDQVILEITETSSMQNPIAMIEYLTQFRIQGFNLAIDDFGVGYSSLVQLARLPFSEIKIDKTFIMSAHYSEESQKIASAVVGLANALGMSATAEGVEDFWTLEFLKSIGCDNAQGFFISRPLDAKATATWCRDWNRKLAGNL